MSPDFIPFCILIISFPVLLKVTSISYTIILLAKLFSKYPVAGMIPLFTLWVMGHFIPKNNFIYVLLDSNHFYKLSVEENTTV